MGLRETAGNRHVDVFEEEDDAWRGGRVEDKGDAPAEATLRRNTSTLLDKDIIARVRQNRATFRAGGGGDSSKASDGSSVEPPQRSLGLSAEDREIIRARIRARIDAQTHAAMMQSVTFQVTEEEEDGDGNAPSGRPGPSPARSAISEGHVGSAKSFWAAVRCARIPRVV